MVGLDYARSVRRVASSKFFSSCLVAFLDLDGGFLRRFESLDLDSMVGRLVPVVLSGRLAIATSYWSRRRRSRFAIERIALRFGTAFLLVLAELAWFVRDLLRDFTDDCFDCDSGFSSCCCFWTVSNRALFWFEFWQLNSSNLASDSEVALSDALVPFRPEGLASEFDSSALAGNPRHVSPGELVPVERKRFDRRCSIGFFTANREVIGNAGSFSISVASCSRELVSCPYSRAWIVVLLPAQVALFGELFPLDFISPVASFGRFSCSTSEAHLVFRVWRWFG